MDDAKADTADLGGPGKAGARAGAPIVVAVDGSDSSLDALRHGIRVASAFNAPLEAVTVWHFPYVAYAPMPVPWDPENDAKAILESSLQKVFGADRPPWLSWHISEGLPAETLIRECKGAGMLVMGSRGHGGFSGLLLGSVSSQCAEHAECPVLVVHGSPPGTSAPSEPT